MTKRRNLDRVAAPLGSQPLFHDHATVDALNAMVIALLGEVTVLRDRLDANERLSEAHGGHGPADVDRYQPDPVVVRERALYRDGSYDRVLGVARDRLMPDALRIQQQAYDRIMDDVSGP
jgi:hypothetical protein